MRSESLSKVSDDDVLIAYSGGTLGRGDPARGTVEAVLDTGKQLTKICPASKGAFVIGLDGYVGHFDGKRITNMPVPGVSTVYCVSEAPDGTVYASAERGGLYRREGKAWKALALGIKGDVNVVVALDAKTALLCGADGLCGRLEGATFVRYQAPASRHYRAMVEYQGRLYVGAGFHGLDVLEGRVVVPFKENILAYHLASSGKYLFASGRNEAARFDGTAWLANAFTNE